MYVVTFYSFKGGVGRTLALVNLGVELAQRGRRVLLVDFDLEAPGVETFDLLRSRTSVPGLIDYVADYLRTGSSPDARDFIYETSGIGRQGGRLWVMPSGRQDETYGSRLNSIDWQELYDQHSGYLMFEDLKAQWQRALEPDYVLIDSRTGHTDVAGICTRQLPDAVVVMFFPNEQNLRGLKRIVADVRAEARSVRRKKIHLHFVTSNVPDLDDEDRILARTLRRFADELHYSDPSATIHHYSSLALVNQAIFTHDRPASRLAREYRELLQEIVRLNPEDPEGALEFLRLIGRRRSRLDIVATEVEERLQKIQEAHAAHGPVVYQLGLVRKRQGHTDEAITLFSEALRAGFGGPEVLLERAELYALRDEPLEALKDISQVLDAVDVTYFHVTSAVRWLCRLAPASLDRLPGAKALHSLDADGRLQVAKELTRSRRALRVAEPILRDVIRDVDSSSPLHQVAKSELTLCLIGLGRFGEAMATISPNRPAPSDLGIDDAFNYAMAEWGASGTPPRDLLSRVVEVDHSREAHGLGPNYDQCLAMALWLLGQPDEAMNRLRRARQQLKLFLPHVFSAWRYLIVSADAFLKDLDAMEQGVKERSLSPAFLGGTGGIEREETD